MEQYLNLTVEIVLKVLGVYLKNYRPVCPHDCVSKSKDVKNEAPEDRAVNDQTDSYVEHKPSGYDRHASTIEEFASSKPWGEREKPVGNSDVLTLDELNSKIKDSSREALLGLYLSSDELKAYEARKQLCWEAADPIKCKQELDDEYARIIDARVNAQNAPNINLDIYKAGLSSLVYFIQQLSVHAGLSEISCKIDNTTNCTWIRIPTLITCISEHLPIVESTKIKLEPKKQNRQNRRANARQEAGMPFEIYEESENDNEKNEC